tara:strand:- start:1339 stop:1893 length:555 start_codon:yes stop_codon:yes gene_type:complete
MNLNGGGLLPVAIDNSGNIKFLFGLERDHWIESCKGWSDFGGATDGVENRLDTACREGEEEMVGFLGSSDDLKKSVIENLILCISTPKYDSHLYSIKYDENLPYYFNNNFKCIEKYNPELLEKEGLYEKREMCWMSLDDLIIRRDEFRKFYAREFIPTILENKKTIIKKLKILDNKYNKFYPNL